jgi:hypothetical protein
MRLPKPELTEAQRQVNESRAKLTAKQRQMLTYLKGQVSKPPKYRDEAGAIRRLAAMGVWR